MMHTTVRCMKTIRNRGNYNDIYISFIPWSNHVTNNNICLTRYVHRRLQKIVPHDDGKKQHAGRALQKIFLPGKVVRLAYCCLCGPSIVFTSFSVFKSFHLNAGRLIRRTK